MTRTSTVKLEEVASFRGGGTPSKQVPEFWAGTIPFVTCTDITGVEVGKSRAFITPAAVEASAAQIIPAGNILVLTRTSVGKVAINTVDLCTSQDFVNVLPDPKRVDTRYLLHFLLSKQAYLVSHQRGATIKGVTKGTVTSLELPLPPLPEQRRIAAILDKADAIRRKRAQATKMVDELVSATFTYLVGPGNPDYRSWPLVSIEELASNSTGSIKSGPFGSALKHSEFVPAGIAVLGIDNAVQNRFAWAERRFITPAKYEELKRYTIRRGDVIITIMGTVGRSAVVPDDCPVAISTKHLATITVARAKVEPEFLSNAMHRDQSIIRQIEEANRGAIMPGLNLGLIRRLRLRLPPLAAQRRFVAVLQAARNLETPGGEADLGASLAARFFVV